MDPPSITFKCASSVCCAIQACVMSMLCHNSLTLSLPSITWGGWVGGTIVLLLLISMLSVTVSACPAQLRVGAGAVIFDSPIGCIVSLNPCNFRGWGLGGSHRLNRMYSNSLSHPVPHRHLTPDIPPPPPPPHTHTHTEI